MTKTYQREGVVVAVGEELERTRSWKDKDDQLHVEERSLGWFISIGKKIGDLPFVGISVGKRPEARVGDRAKMLIEIEVDNRKTLEEGSKVK